MTDPVQPPQNGQPVAPRATQGPLTGAWGDTPWIGEDQPDDDYPLGSVTI
jgi:hypothetical protein